MEAKGTEQASQVRMNRTAAWVTTGNRGALPLCFQERVVEGQLKCGKDTMTVFTVEGPRWREERAMGLRLEDAWLNPGTGLL